jgi:hypothetical protein
MTIEISMIGSRVGHVSQPDGTNGYAFASGLVWETAVENS